MKLRAFTLAETLITLGIIGIVAAMTLPALIKNYQKHIYETSVKKAYTITSEAIKLYMNDNDVWDLTNADFVNNQENLRNFVNKYFKVIGNCGNKYYDGKTCFAKTYFSLDKSNKVDMSKYQCMYNVKLVDGTAMCFDSGAIPDSDDGAHSATLAVTSKIVLSVEIDINGAAGPNVAGLDYFSFVADQHGKVYDAYYNATNDSYTWWTPSLASPMSIGRIMSNGWKINYY